MIGASGIAFAELEGMHEGLSGLSLSERSLGSTVNELYVRYSKLTESHCFSR